MMKEAINYEGAVSSTRWRRPVDVGSQQVCLLLDVLGLFCGAHLLLQAVDLAVQPLQALPHC